MSKQIKRTRVIANWYRGSDEFSALMNYRILRAGHIDTGADFHVQRQSVVGHELIFACKDRGLFALKTGFTRYKRPVSLAPGTLAA